MKIPYDAKVHYLFINRGRYLCAEHGGFCDSSDNYIPRCPICIDVPESRVKWGPNNIDRSLQMLRNLQGRSQRSAAIVAGLFGTTGAIIALTGKDNPVKVFLQSEHFFVFLALALILAALSLAAFMLSMNHMPTTRKKRDGSPAFMHTTISGWEKYIARHMDSFELWHYAGTILFVCASITLLAGAIWSWIVWIG